MKRRFKPAPLFSRINVVPLAAVWLALFIMVAVERGSVVDGRVPEWPKVTHAVPLPGANRDDALFIAVRSDGRLFFGTEAVSPEQLCARLPEQFARTGERAVYLSVHQRAKSRWVNQVIDCASAAGVQRIAFLTGNVRPSVW